MKFLRQTLPPLLAATALLATTVSAQSYRDPGRFEKAIAAFEANEVQTPSPSNAIVAYGSSSIRLWAESGNLTKDLAPLTVVHRGFGGSNMNDALHFFDRAILPLKPRALIVYEGDNDISQGVSVDLVLETFDKLIAKTHAAFPKCRIHLLAIKPSQSRAHLRPKIDEANKRFAAKCATDPRLHFMDVATPVLDGAGAPNPAFFLKDRLHLNRAGYEQWVTVVRPHLLRTELRHEPINNALVPRSKIERDGYDWWKRHAAVLQWVNSGKKADVILIGDSITHFWGGEPKAKLRRGIQAWDSLFANHTALNLGFGWDRIQNVLWRIDHGELANQQPRLFVVHIGTNNLAGTANARASTPREIAEGIATVCDRLHAHAPKARIVLMNVFPRGRTPDHRYRTAIAAINQGIAPLAERPYVDLLDLTPRLLDANGHIPKSLMPDGLHPNAAGYQVWADALKPFVDALPSP